VFISFEAGSSWDKCEAYCFIPNNSSLVLLPILAESVLRAVKIPALQVLYPALRALQNKK
jgi:hypothetical protein